MLKIFYLKSFLILMFLCQQKPWELVVDKDDIKVFTRKTDSTSIKEYKVTMRVRSPMDSVLKKVLDIKNLKNWSYRIAESRLLKKINDSSWVFYIHNNVEWPIQDRDHVSKVELRREKSEYKVFLTPYNNFLKEKPNVVRLTKFRGLWTIKRVDDLNTQVTQQLFGDPKSNIPPFFINLMIAKAPFYTFKKMKTQLENKK